MTRQRRLLLPLAPIYAAMVRWKRRLFAEGRLRSRSLDDTVISVGSLSAGGAGKTPVVLLLATMLARRGYAVRILTRGYGRGSKVVERVDPAGNAGRFGDEPLLLAQRSGVPVYVGADRYRAGLMAEAEEVGRRGGRTVVYLLDDGFQHQRLKRDLDVVLLTRKDVGDALLPAGDLREPLSALRDADVVVVREEEAASLGEVMAALTVGAGAPPVWVVRRRLKLMTPGGGRLPVRPLVFCGIARPEGFLGMLEAEGVKTGGVGTEGLGTGGMRPAATVIFADHYAYGERDVERLVEQAEAAGADGFITTEKDAVKLTKGMRGRMERVGRVVVAELQVELVDERAALRQMIAMAPRLDRRRDR